MLKYNIMNCHPNAGNLELEETCSSEKSVDFQRSAQDYIQENWTTTVRNPEVNF
jgi:hypothetical protein